MKNILFFFAFICLTYFANAQWQQTSLDSCQIDALIVSENNLFAGARLNSNSTNGGVFLSSNNGSNWGAINTGLTNTNVLSLAIKGDTVFAGTNSGGVFLSTNNGSSWTDVNTGLPANIIVYALAISGSYIFAGTNNGVFLSTNNGNSWTAVNTGLPTPTYISALAVKGDTIFAGVWNNGVSIYGVFFSTNNGGSWVATTLTGAGVAGRCITAFAISGSNIFVGAYQWGVYLSSNNGNNWSHVGNPNSGLTDTINTSLAISGSNIFVGSQDGVYLSTNNGLNWSAWNSGFINHRFVLSLAISGDYIFAGNDSLGVWKRKLSDITVSLNDINSNKNNIAVYPNPAKNNLTFECQQKSIMEILNNQGQTILQHQLQQGKTDIDISRLAKGLYILRLNNNDKTEVTKFLKE